MKLFGAPQTVLLVEDDAMIRENTAQNLTDEGYVVLQASSAKDAMAHVEQTPAISILISDIDIDGPIDGFGLSKAVRDLQKKIHIILISGAVLPAQDDEADFIQKPYRLEELIEVMKAG